MDGKATGADAPALPDGVVGLRPHIKAPAALQTALAYIGFVENDEDGDRAAPQLKAGQSIVSRSGAYWRWDGLQIRAKAMDRNAIRLKNKNRLEELQAQLPQAQEKAASSNETLQTAQGELASSRQKSQSMEQEVRSLDRTVAQKRTDLQRAIEKRSATESEIAKLEEGVTLAQDDIARLDEAVTVHRTSLGSFDDAALQQQNMEVEQRKLALQAAQAALSEASAALEIFQQDTSRRAARLRAIGDERVNLNNRTIRSKERLKSLAERMESTKQKLAEIEQRPAEITRLRIELLDNLKTLENARNDAADTLAAAEKSLGETTAKLKSAENELMEIRERRAKAQATMEASSSSIEIIRQSIEDQFAMSPEALWSSSEMNNEKLYEEPIEKIRSKRDRLIRERDGMGAVNLRADIESQEVEQTLTKIISERADLTQAIEELRGGINRLNKEARERLQQAFDTVNNHFKVLFTRLFGGGAAHLAFVDSDDPLEASLEIFAQPRANRSSLFRCFRVARRRWPQRHWSLQCSSPTPRRSASLTRLMRRLMMPTWIACAPCSRKWRRCRKHGSLSSPTIA